jgi:enamine deaminase RidA (YjgF/YER057c/UK114 family)
MTPATDPVEARLAEMGLKLPTSSPSRANFLPFRRSGNLLFLAGQICEWEGVAKFFGPITAQTDMSVAKTAAQMCALNLLFNIRAALGGLDKVATVIRLGGFVSSEPGFGEGPKVIDGASELFISLYGAQGQHARTAVCVTSLPVNAMVEVDAIIEIAGS